MHDYLLRRAATSETMNPGPYFSIIIFVLLLLLFSNHCCFHLSRVTCASLGVAELTTQLRRALSILWLPLSWINKLGYTTREDCYDPLHLWVINTIFWRRCQGAITLIIGSLGKYSLSLYSLYCYFYQGLTSFKLDLIGKADSRRINKNIIRNTACHKKGYTYGK